MPYQAPYQPLVPGLNSQLSKLSDIPLIGPWTARLGKVNRILGYPCHPTPEIWIEAFAHASIHGVLSVISPTCVDYLVSRFARPRPGGRHGKPGGRIPRKPRIHMDIYKMLPLQQFTLDGVLGHYALRTVELARAFGWYVALADATTDGLLNWTSLAYQWSGCDQPGSIGAQAHAVPGSVLLFQGAWLPVNNWIWDQHVGVATGPGGFVTPRGKSTHVTWHVTSHPPEDVPGCEGATCRFRLVNVTTGKTYEAPRVPLNGGTTSQSGGLLDYDAGEADNNSLRVEYFIEGCGFAIIDSGHITFTSNSVTSMFAPQQPCPPAHGG